MFLKSLETTCFETLISVVTKMGKSLIGLILILLLSCPFVYTNGQEKNDMSHLFNKEEVTIVITDSGLGGLSVMDNVAKQMRGSGCFKKVNLIFANALFDVNTGYNALKTREDKIKIFSSVLEGIEKHYHPDLIMIACNTLSVVYKETNFVRNSKTPVLGIVEPGVRLIAEKLEINKNSDVIILGTETTIEEGSHRKALLEQNIANDRIITMACPQLQSYIEQNPSGEETEMLISVYLNEALEKLPLDHGTVFLSLNCSHFSYSVDLWKKAFSNTSYKLGGILDPNLIMGNKLMDERILRRFSETKISYLVVSKVELINVKAMFKIFHTISPELADALKNYSLISDLF
jgi:glutamate racemase